MRLVVVVTPHFVHLYADFDAVMRREILLVHLLYHVLFFLSALMTVSGLISSSRAIARTPAPSTDHFIMSRFTFGLHPLYL
jgi:cytochrome c oxidase assembly factor CtaG